MWWLRVEDHRLPDGLSVVWRSVEVTDMSANPSIYRLEPAYELAEWFDMSDARKAARLIATQRRALENLTEEHIDRVAEAEAAYDRKVGERVEFHKGAGKGSGEAELLAKKDAAGHKKDREHGQQMLRLLFKKLDGLDGERAVLRQFNDWSARMEGRDAA